ncbi:MAG: DUF932 domain-containing protein [Gammaproteobacteria bacterium]
MSSLIQSVHSSSRPALSIDTLRRRVPAAFADRQFEKTGSNYVFISTEELVDALRDVGFHPTDARQRWSRGDRLGYARHMIRFRASDDLRIVDCTPEVILINSHDATSAYQLRGGLYRFVCCNGLIISLADFGVVHIPHRGNVVASVVDGARQIMDQLKGVGPIIEQMARTELDQRAREAFAQRALEMRYRHQDRFPFDASRLLESRRESDQGDSLWSVYNRVQENVICGGITGKTATGRRTSSRKITALQEDVRLNVALWHEAMALIRR